MNTINVSDFLRNDFREFSVYDCKINIPNIIDGLKISQRKLMWTVLNHPKKFTVEQLAALTASYTRYHHGSKSLESVASNLAQNFTGSNNVNWLTPDGQFGNILSNDASSSRYISTFIDSNWRKWFKKEDDTILAFEYEDGEITEPTFFIPLAPTVLFNGSAGIGTGYASNIFAYNPKEVVENVKLAIAGKPLKEMTPYYEGYKGTIKKVNRQTIFQGAYEKVNATTIRITQVPIGYDLARYKEVLVGLMESGEIKDFDDNSTEDEWNITIRGNREWFRLPEEMIIEKLALTTKDTENFVVWSENNRILRFSNPNQIIQYFVNWRLGKFEERRLKVIQNLKDDLQWMYEKQKFIQYFIDHSTELVKLGKADLAETLTGVGFAEIDRLLQIKVYNMTKDEILALETDISGVKTKISTLEATTAKKMYTTELNGVKI